MNILGVNVPNLPENCIEICHELTIRYSLAKMGRKTGFNLDTNTFQKHLKGKCTPIKKAPGVIATFWEKGNLFHSMIVGNDDSEWIGSNNLNTFQQNGNRVSIDVSKILSGEDEILLKISGNEDAHLYDLKYYAPEDIAHYVLESDPEPDCCCR